MAMWSRKRTFLIAILLCGTLGLAFVAGGVFVAKRVYPYDAVVNLIRPAKQAAPKREAGYLEKFTVESAFHRLDVTRVDVTPQIGAYSQREGAGKQAWGGGIVAYGNDVIGVSNHGKFFLYRAAGEDRSVKRLNIQTEHNRDAFVSYLENKGIASFDPARWFRHIDLIYTETASETALILSHIYWHTDAACYTLRLSKLPLDGFAGLESVAKAADDWSTVYDSKPCLPIKDTGAPYAGHQAGGRMALAPDGTIYLSVGDFQFDGYNSSEVHPQDRSSDYGKIIRVDPASGTSEIVSLGHRNPQGLYLNDNGDLWSTEHGPRGGDELNLIQAGANYGWPHVLYGTDYGQNVWPLSKAQGRHDGYRRPVYAWYPSIAISNLIVAKNFAPEWDGDILVSSLGRQSLFRMRYHGGRIVYFEPVFVGARIRDLDQLADGTIVLWNDGGKLTELRVADAAGLEVAAWMPADLSEDQKKTVAATVFQCLDCHSVLPGGPNVNGPRLWKVHGRRFARSIYAGYSDAIKNKTGVWDDAALDAFLKDGDAFAPGNVMAFEPLTDEGVRRGVIAYLKTLKPSY